MARPKKEETINIDGVTEEIEVTTSVPVETNPAILDKRAEQVRRKIAQDFKAQEKRYVKIPPLYKPYFGRVMTVSINGIAVAVPVDGKAYLVPEAFANEVEARMYKQDQLKERGEKLSDTRNNFESSPGELELF